MEKKSTIDRNSTTRIIIVEDMELYRLAMSMVILQIEHFELVAAVASGKEMKKALKEGNIQIVLMDIQLIGESGITLTEYIKKNHPEVLVVGLTTCEDSNTFFRMLAAGASGYLLKDASKAEFEDAINSVLNGNEYFSPKVSFQVINRISRNYENDMTHIELGGFSLREVQIIKMICKGESNGIIADKLEISIRTVEKHRYNIMKNMKVKSSTAMIAYAIKNKLFDVYTNT